MDRCETLNKTYDHFPYSLIYSMFYIFIYILLVVNTHIKHIMRSDYLQEMPIRKVFQKLSEGITHMVILKNWHGCAGPFG